MKTSETEETVRSFCAIPLDEATRKLVILLQRELRDTLPGVRWGHPETLHLTLRFFGDMPLEFLEKAAKVMLSVDGLGAPFKLPFKGLGAFPSSARPRVLWLGLENSGRMQQLYNGIQEALATAGIPREKRPFVPHLTLGRARGRLPDVTALLQKHGNKIEGALPVERVIIYQSQLLPQGAKHTPLHTLTLHPTD
jgi:2'-5' RNA ligase